MKIHDISSLLLYTDQTGYPSVGTHQSLPSRPLQAAQSDIIHGACLRPLHSNFYSDATTASTRQLHPCTQAHAPDLPPTKTSSRLLRPASQVHFRHTPPPASPARYHRPAWRLQPTDIARHSRREIRKWDRQLLLCVRPFCLHPVRSRLMLRYHVRGGGGPGGR